MRWQAIRKDDMRKAAVEEKRAAAEEKRAMAELIAEENKTMVMDPSTMDPFTREWWDLARFGILQRRRQEAFGGVTLVVVVVAVVVVVVLVLLTVMMVAMLPVVLVTIRQLVATSMMPLPCLILSLDHPLLHAY
jgi:Flp pilus assembly protein TadB